MFGNPEKSRKTGKRWTKTREDTQKIKWQTDLNPTMSTFMINVNGVYTQKKAENSIIAIIKKQDPIIFCLWKINFKYKDTNGLKVSGWKKINHKYGKTQEK